MPVPEITDEARRQVENWPDLGEAVECVRSHNQFTSRGMVGIVDRIEDSGFLMLDWGAGVHYDAICAIHEIGGCSKCKDR